MKTTNPPTPPRDITLRKHRHFSESSKPWLLDGLVKGQVDPWRMTIPPKVRWLPPAPPLHRPIASSRDASCTTAVVAGYAATAVPFPSPLVPLDLPFNEGTRYREAGATEVSTRCDLFLPDESGPWVRRYGVLLKVAQPKGRLVTRS